MVCTSIPAYWHGVAFMETLSAFQITPSLFFSFEQDVKNKPNGTFAIEARKGKSELAPSLSSWFENSQDFDLDAFSLPSKRALSPVNGPSFTPFERRILLYIQKTLSSLCYNASVFRYPSGNGLGRIFSASLTNIGIHMAHYLKILHCYSKPGSPSAGHDWLIPRTGYMAHSNIVDPHTIIDTLNNIPVLTIASRSQSNGHLEIPIYLHMSLSRASLANTTTQDVYIGTLKHCLGNTFDLLSKCILEPRKNNCPTKLSKISNFFSRHINPYKNYHQAALGTNSAGVPSLIRTAMLWYWVLVVLSYGQQTRKFPICEAFLRSRTEDGDEVLGGINRDSRGSDARIYTSAWSTVLVSLLWVETGAHDDLLANLITGGFSVQEFLLVDFLVPTIAYAVTIAEDFRIQPSIFTELVPRLTFDHMIFGYLLRCLFLDNKLFRGTCRNCPRGSTPMQKCSTAPPPGLQLQKAQIEDYHFRGESHLHPE
ncbi:uncharacterized protein BDR25DRAFT_355908 [Lindgomyces ingoldianus]|uniref:Uncharacterized protein n=1 Tax=Lindgomyces ingoldianus TaxID=673940 RepID=A0ACB6QTJ4_9PLEO|nr:uncharacterized protein BDR25DRAFT_355908 [Lindgomyces ingoldianus]KAF2470205.1 hypothetical protein BDR25DRAFT_355908 [Lindgomyces ingoldianus]